MAELNMIDRNSLLNEIEKNLDKYDDKKDMSRGFAVGIKLITSVLGAAVAVFLGWKSEGKPVEWMTNLALVFGASISAINTIDAFFSFSSRWTHYKDVCTQLIFLRKEAKNEKDIDVNTSILEVYKTRLSDILVYARKGEVELHKTRK